MKKILKIILKSVIGLSMFLAISLLAFYFFLLYPRYEVPILTYHYFGHDTYVDGRPLPMLFITEENFEKQMRYLKDKHYQVITLDALMQGIKNGKHFTHNTVVITIDDGHKSVYTYAYPVLKKYGFPATVFLASGLVNNKSDYIAWEQVREMSRNNITFGAHTKTHIYLPPLKDKARLREEIFGSKKIIEEKIPEKADYFCYPTGGFTGEIVALVKEAGYKGACSTNRGEYGSATDIYMLNRISIRDSDPYFSFSNIDQPATFRVKLSGYYNSFRKRRHGV